jgi:hypothetical protein
MEWENNVDVISLCPSASFTCEISYSISISSEIRNQLFVWDAGACADKLGRPKVQILINLIKHSKYYKSIVNVVRLISFESMAV